MKTIEEYKAMVKELKALGEELIKQAYDNEDECDEEWLDEIECMDIHLDCCLYELNKH